MHFSKIGKHLIESLLFDAFCVFFVPNILMLTKGDLRPRVFLRKSKKIVQISQNRKIFDYFRPNQISSWVILMTCRFKCKILVACTIVQYLILPIWLLLYIGNLELYILYTYAQGNATCCQNTVTLRSRPFKGDSDNWQDNFCDFFES